MEVKEWLTLLGFVVTWMGLLIGFARGYGALSTRVAKNEQEISAVKARFVDSDGEPRLVSATGCKRERVECSRLMDERQANIERRLAVTDGKMDRVLETLSEIRGELKARAKSDKNRAD